MNQERRTTNEEQQANASFVFISNPWADGVKNPTSKHHIARELLTRGHRVLWINATGMRVPAAASPSDWKRIVGKLRSAVSGQRAVYSVQRGERETFRDSHNNSTTQQPNNSTTSDLDVVSPLIIPVPGSKWARKVNSGIYMREAEKWVKQVGAENPVLVNFLPLVPELMASWPWKSIYYCVDRWDAFERYDSELMAALDEANCRQANLVLASARGLYDRCKQHNPNTHLVSHGVDYRHFSSVLRARGETTDDGQRTTDNGRQATASDHNEEPSFAKATAGRRRTKNPPSPRLRRPGQERRTEAEKAVVGFFGLISEWVDQQLLVKLAREIPEARILLIGKADVDVTALQDEKNIEMPGPCAFDELPERVADFTVGIIPFVVNDLTACVNPIKLREMLAAGCGVVSTDLPEVVGGAVETAGTTRPLDYRTTRGGFEGVWVAGDHEEFVEMVKEKIEKPLSLEEREALSRSVADETWGAKVDGFLELVGLLK